MVAAAIIGAGIAAGAGTAIAGSAAAGATTSSTNAAIAEQQSALQQQATLSAPYRGVGQAAIGQYEGLLGIGPNANAQTIQEALANTPGYQFTKAQGEQGILNNTSLQGLTGNTLTSLDTFNTGLADQTYQNALSNSYQAVGLGQAAAAGQAANVGQAASNISGLVQSQGQNIANIDIGEAAGISKALGGSAGNYMDYSALQALGGAGAGPG